MALAWEARPSLRSHAIWLGLCSGSTLSKQALHRRLKHAEAFLRECLQTALAKRLCPPAIHGAFTRILVQDSTCVSLDARTAAHFPGPCNQSGKPQACVRIQCIYDLLTERFWHLRLDSFTRNDQAAAKDVLCLLKAGDLLVRDLGYFTLQSLAAIAQRGASFLTRWRFGVQLHDASGGGFDLAGALREGERLERQLWLGKDKSVAVRLVAIPVPVEVANERRRKARANRDKRLKPSKAYLRLLGWNIFVTNASPSDLPGHSISALYQLRWRIEILFKAWKSHLHLCSLRGRGAHHVVVLAWGLLLFIVLTHHQTLPAETGKSRAGKSAARPPASLLKSTQLLSQTAALLLLAHLTPDQLAARIQQQLLVHSSYESRTRLNYLQLRSQALS